MTTERIIELLKIEHQCILRNTNNECDRNCAKCDLVQDDGDLHEMYTDAITLLKKQEPQKMLEVEDDDLYAWSPEDVNYYCPRPECGREISYNYNFCPYCGQAVK